jgi:hypothetical protein
VYAAPDVWSVHQQHLHGHCWWERPANHGGAQWASLGCMATVAVCEGQREEPLNVHTSAARVAAGG